MSVTSVRSPKLSLQDEAKKTHNDLSQATIPGAALVFAGLFALTSRGQGGNPKTGLNRYGKKPSFTDRFTPEFVLAGTSVMKPKNLHRYLRGLATETASTMDDLRCRSRPGRAVVDGKTPFFCALRASSRQSGRFQNSRCSKSRPQTHQCILVFHQKLTIHFLDRNLLTSGSSVVCGSDSIFILSINCLSSLCEQLNLRTTMKMATVTIFRLSRLS